MNDLLSHYKVYILMLNNADGINNNKNHELNDNCNSKIQIVNQKGKDGLVIHGIPRNFQGIKLMEYK